MPNAAARLLNRITGLPLQLRTLFTKTIWTASALEDNSLRGRLHGACRVFSLTWVGLSDNKLVSRAAGLSYSSLLSIGPLIAIAVLLVQAPLYWVSASQVAAEVLKVIFCPKGVCSPAAAARWEVTSPGGELVRNAG